MEELSSNCKNEKRRKWEHTNLPVAEMKQGKNVLFVVLAAYDEQEDET